LIEEKKKYLCVQALHPALPQCFRWIMGQSAAKAGIGHQLAGRLHAELFLQRPSGLSSEDPPFAPNTTDCPGNFQFHFAI